MTVTYSVVMIVSVLHQCQCAGMNSISFGDIPCRGIVDNDCRVRVAIESLAEVLASLADIVREVVVRILNTHVVAVGLSVKDVSAKHMV